MRYVMICVLMAALGCAANDAHAQTQANSFADNTLTGDWGGARQRLHEEGVDLGGDFVSDFAGNLTGGDERTTAIAYEVGFHAKFNFQKLWGWTGSSLHLDIVNRGGTELDAKADLGTLMSTQEIFAGRITHLINLYFEQSLWHGKVNAKIGRISFGDVFFQYPCNFQALSFCGPEPAFLAPNDINNGAYSQLGATLTFEPTHLWYASVGGFKVNPNNRLRKHGLFFTAPGSDTGTLLVAEVGVHTDIGGGAVGPLRGTWKIGGWHSSANHKDLFFDVDGNPQILTDAQALIRHSNRGIYVVLQQQVTHNAVGGGLTVIADFLDASANVYPVNQITTLQFSYQGISAARPHDRIDLAFGRNRVSSSFARNIHVGNEYGFPFMPVPGSEYEVALNYFTQVWHGLSLMPNVQYIYHPGGTPANHDALVLGLELDAEF